MGEGLSDLGQGTVKAATTLYTMDNNKKADELTGGFFHRPDKVPVEILKIF